MADYDNETETRRFGTEPSPWAPRRGVDLFMLLSGVLTLGVSAYVLSDGPGWLRGVDPRWLIAGGALFVGLLLLFLSVRSGRRR